MVYLAIIILILILDLYTKSVAVKNLEVEEKRKAPFKNTFWWHRKNYGVAYSQFSKFPNAVKLVTSVLTLMGYLFLFILLRFKGLRTLKIGLSMALGGASGNLIDRVRNNCVTDFIYIRCENAPIFNLADVFIVIGSLAAAIAALKIKD